jgi:hypothetical protein
MSVHPIKSAKVKRPSISKRLRFEVFKRDSFTCQYCGKSAPEVVLHIDHISPVAGGGDSDIMNLITSCVSCNLGKGARQLDDRSVITKQKAQLDELNRRREQLEMMLQWREVVSSVTDDSVAALEAVFAEITGRTFSDHGRKKVKTWLRRHNVADLCDAMESAGQTYWKDSDDEGEQSEQAEKVFIYTPIIIAAKKRNADKPWMKDLYWCRAVIRNRHRCIEHIAIKLLVEAYEAGISIDDLKDFCRQSTSWSSWQNTLEDAIYGEPE